MLHLILLAAGNSRRFGSENKLLYPIDGRPMILHTLDKLTSLACENGWDLTVVTQAGPVEQLIDSSRARLVLNPDSAQGISTSIRCALNALPQDGAPAAFFVADQPYLKKENASVFLSACLHAGKGLACVTHADQTGNPTFFAARYFPELLSLKGDRGGKRVILAHPDDCFLFPIDDADELRDIDERPV